MALPLIGLAVGALAGGAKKGIGAWQEQKELRKQAKQYNLTQERKASQIEHLASQEGANRQQAYNFASRALAKYNMSQENRERTLAMAQQAMGESLNRAFQARGAAAEARGHKMTVPSAPSFGSLVAPILGGAIEGGLAGASVQSSMGAAKSAKDMADEIAGMNKQLADWTKQSDSVLKETTGMQKSLLDYITGEAAQATVTPEASKNYWRFPNASQYGDEPYQYKPRYFGFM